MDVYLDRVWCYIRDSVDYIVSKHLSTSDEGSPSVVDIEELWRSNECMDLKTKYSLPFRVYRKILRGLMSYGLIHINHTQIKKGRRFHFPEEIPTEPTEDFFLDEKDLITLFVNRGIDIPLKRRPSLTPLFSFPNAGLTLLTKFLPNFDLSQLRISSQFFKAFTQEEFTNRATFHFNEYLPPRISVDLVSNLTEESPSFSSLLPPPIGILKESQRITYLNHLLDGLIAVVKEGHKDEQKTKLLRDHSITLFLRIGDLSPSSIFETRTNELADLRTGKRGTIDYFWDTTNQWNTELEKMFLILLPSMSYTKQVFEFDEICRDVRQAVTQFLPNKDLAIFRCVSKEMKILTQDFFIDRASRHFLNLRKRFSAETDLKWFESLAMSSSDLPVLVIPPRAIRSDLSFDCQEYFEAMIQCFIRNGISIRRRGKKLKFSQLYEFFLRLSEEVPDLILQHERFFVRECRIPVEQMGGVDSNYNRKWYRDSYNRQIGRILLTAKEESRRRRCSEISPKAGKVCRRRVFFSRKGDEMYVLLHLYLQNREGVLDREVPSRRRTRFQVRYANDQPLGFWFHLFVHGPEIGLLILKLYFKVLSSEDFKKKESLKIQPLKGCIRCLWTNGFYAGYRCKGELREEIYRIMEKIMRLYYHEQEKVDELFFQEMKKAMEKDVEENPRWFERRVMMDKVTPLCGRFKSTHEILQRYDLL